MRLALALMIASIGIPPNLQPRAMGGVGEILHAPLKNAGNVPACTSADSCVLDCGVGVFDGSSAWQCVNGARAQVAVTQGTGTFEAAGFGSVQAERIKADADAPSLTTNTYLGNPWAGDYTIIIAGAPGSVGSSMIVFSNGASPTDGVYAYADTTPAWKCVTSNPARVDAVVTIDPRLRWGVMSCRHSAGGAGPTIARYNGTDGSPVNAGVAVAPTTEPFYFGRYATAAVGQMQGPLARTRIFTRQLAASELAIYEASWFGTIAETRNVSVTRASTAWGIDDTGILRAFGDNTGRVTGLGLRVEQAATNYLLQSRDVSNAAWVKTTATATLTAAGKDGLSSSASILTATAGNGTALQNITGLASLARTCSYYLRRRTGSGTVQITADNGVGWTTVVPPASWDSNPADGEGDRFSVTGAASTSIGCGVRLVTNGDAVDVDLVQAEDGSFATSPIVTTTVALARAAETASAPDAGIPHTSGRVRFTFTNEAWGGISGGSRELFSSVDAAGKNGIFIYDGGGGNTLNCRGIDNSGSGSNIGGGVYTWNPFATSTFDCRWGGGSGTFDVNGVRFASTPSGMLFPTEAASGSFWLCDGKNGIDKCNGWIRDLLVSP